MSVLLSMVALNVSAEFDRWHKVKLGTGNLYYCLDEENKLAEVTSSPEGPYSGSVSIPSSVQDNQGQQYQVISIGELAFHNCPSLTSVTMLNSIKTIDRSAFQNCSSLQSIRLSSNLTTINYRAFYGCKKLSSITLPTALTDIGEEAFLGCKSLTAVSFPASLTTIGKMAF